MKTISRASVASSIRRNIRIGLAIIIFLVGGVGGWASSTQISGAVIAPGTLVVDSNVKKVQHPTGGVVAEILTRDGDRVRAGDVVVRLDATITRASLAIVNKGLQELMARKARLEAERDSLPDVRFPPALVRQADDPEVAASLAGERKLYALRRSARRGQKDQLRQRIAQLEEEIVGYSARERAKVEEIALIARELTGARELWDKGLMPISKLTALEREATRLEGERAQLQSVLAQSKGRIAETELQVIQIDHDLSSEVSKELREIDAKMGELVERKVAAEDSLKRIDIRAPRDGVVHQSSVHTVGGVVNAGETLMLVVPVSDNLDAEVKVAPLNVDQLRLDQPVTLRFSGLNQRTTPELRGSVTRISADTTVDARSGITYYTVRVAVPKDQTERLGTITLVSGMPVEAFIETEPRNVLSYFLKPFSDQVARAFRER